MSPPEWFNGSRVVPGHRVIEGLSLDGSRVTASFIVIDVNSPFQ
jgi:hypothetical protein